MTSNGHIRDYVYKSEILKNHQDLLHQQKIVSKALYLNQDRTNPKTGEVILSVDEAIKIFKENQFESDWIECSKINHSSYARTRRIANRITYMINKGPCVFLTLTFDDACLNRTNQLTRRRLVTRYLKSQSNEFVANIDFGGENGREHFHAVVLADSVDYALWRKNGNINGKKVRTLGASDKKIAKYISKLTNHAIKATTKRYAIIYSR